MPADMTDLLPTEALPVPAPAAAAKRRRPRWVVSVAAGVAGSLGCAGAAVLSDSRAHDGDEATVTHTAEGVPVLAVGAEDGGLSSAISEYGVTAWSSDTRHSLLEGWGAVTSPLAPPLPPPTGLGLTDDLRLFDPAAPAFVDPCTAADDCTVGGQTGVILGADRMPPNAVTVVAFPQPDTRVAAECAFDDLEDDGIPVAVVTANPGEVSVTVGERRGRIESPESEREEWERWMERPVGVRPVESFVAHCVVVPRPAGPGPFEVRAVAVDDDEQEAIARTAVMPLVEGLPPVTVTPIDATMVRVEVPLPAGADQAVVTGVPLAVLGGAADCNQVTPELAASLATGWRRGATAVASPPAAPGRAYLAGAPRVQRVTLPLNEGEVSLLCITAGAGPALRRASLLVTPPDARRLTLAVTELDLVGAPPGGVIDVRATFPEVDWTPCGATVPASGGGVANPGPAGILCTSGGDSGAIADAGGLLDVTLTVAGRATHRARIAVSARGGGAPIEAYRLPVPRIDVEGVLCTTGADQPGCVAPEREALTGSLVLAALWDEGPIGPDAWAITSP